MSQQVIELKKQKVSLCGICEVPKKAKGIVIFVHGSGSSRWSPRNQFVAKALQEKNLATFLFDLLTEKEEEIDLVTREIRFNIPLLSDRLVEVTEWVIERYPKLSIGYFGASTGAAAALIAAARLPEAVHAVVSRGGRPDLAGEMLPSVKAPTLLIVGGEDDTVIALNREARKKMSCVNELKIIPGATHLFEEKGKLEEVTLASLFFFKKYLF